MAKKRIMILAGGRSDEHDVSIISARCVLAALRHTSLEATATVITREGGWLGPEASQKALTDGHAHTGGTLLLREAQLADSYDAIFPLIHGSFGEDGTLQGLLEMADLPYVGSGVLGSALCMDKAMTKEVLRANNIPQVTYLTLHRHAFKNDPTRCVTDIARRLKGPWFVKPANLGSSVGISKVAAADGLSQALQVAFAFDRRVIVESAVANVRELEVAILGNNAIKASVVGEITYDAEFYDYKAKYLDGTARMHIPADLPDALAMRCRAMAGDAYQLLDCAGFARIDLFYRSETAELYLNEINTIPGFTPMSMFPKLWEASGISYSALIGELVDMAIERHAERAAARSA